MLLLVGQKQAEVEDPTLHDLYATGTVAQVREINRSPTGERYVVPDGQQRVRVLSVHDRGSYLEAGVAN